MNETRPRRPRIGLSKQLPAFNHLDPIFLLSLCIKWHSNLSSQCVLKDYLSMFCILYRSSNRWFMYAIYLHDFLFIHYVSSYDWIYSIYLVYWRMAWWLLYHWPKTGFHCKLELTSSQVFNTTQIWIIIQG